MSSSHSTVTSTLTLVFYFIHNLDASLAAKSLQSSILGSGGSADCRLIPLSLSAPDQVIARETKAVEGVTDICVLGYCPEDFTTMDLAEITPAISISYFLYENNIQYGDKLRKALVKKEMEKRVRVFKPSSFKSEYLACGDSMCSMMIEMIGHGLGIDYGLACRTAMAAVSRWYTRNDNGIKDLNIAWALRYDEHIRESFAGSSMDLSEVVGSPSPEVTARTRAMLEAIYNTLAIRKMTMADNLKFKSTMHSFRTVAIGAEHVHDVYRRLIALWDNFIIVSRSTGLHGVEGYLVSLSVKDRAIRSACMQQLGITKFWMEGDLSVGFTTTNPLI